LKTPTTKFHLFENQLMNAGSADLLCFNVQARGGNSADETAPVSASEPMFDYLDDVYDYSDTKKDLLIQTLTESILQTVLRVYESSSASEEGPIKSKYGKMVLPRIIWLVSNSVPDSN